MRFKGQQFPVSALVNFMPKPDVRVESMGPKTLPGVFVGYHVNPGGEWSGDYLVADLEYFRKNPDVPRSKVKIHRIKEVVPNLDGAFVFPVAVLASRAAAQRRQLRSLRRSCRRRTLGRR